MSFNFNKDETPHLMSRIDSLEKNLFEMHSSIASYAIKIAKIRDIGDILSANILKYSENETIDTSLRQGLTNFANCLNLIQDFRDDQVKHIEEKVINELSIYGELTKRAKEELKSNSVAKEKQISVTNTIGRDLKNRDMSRSNSLSEIPNAMTAYELQIQRFEKKKICDLKRIFLELTKSELLMHSKTIEVLTNAYKHLLNIDADSDLQEFCTFFKMNNLGSPQRRESIKTSNEEINESVSPLRRFNSVPSFGTTIEERSNPNESKSIETIGHIL